MNSVRAAVAVGIGVILAATFVGCYSSNTSTDEPAANDELKLPKLKPAAPGVSTGALAKAAANKTNDPYFELGVYLTSIAACGSCHGSDPTEPASPLSGGRMVKDQFGNVYAPNITPHRETGIGTWKVAEVVRAIRSSVGKNDRPLSLDLHSAYRWMSDRDAKAIATYLLASPAVKNEVERRELGVFERKTLGLFSKYTEIEGYIPAPRRSDTPAYGRYLAKSVSNCSFCHTEAGGMDSSATPFAGGEHRTGGRGLFESIAALGEMLASKADKTSDQADAAAVLAAADGGPSHSAPTKALNLENGFPVGGPDIRGTSGEQLKNWTVEQIADFLSFGTTPDGRKVDGGLCPWPYYSIMEDSDKLAISRFLKTL